MKKLAVIRTVGGTPCPFGLSVGVGCSNAGDTVMRMEAIENVPFERREKQRELNIAAYALYAEGTRCVFADKMTDDKRGVHCDWHESGAGISDFPIAPVMRPARFYGNVSGFYSYPIGNYSDNPLDSQIFHGMFGSYASNGRVPYNMAVWSGEPDPELLKLVKAFISEEK